MSTSIESDKTFVEYGSKEWANLVLRIAVHEVYNSDRDLSARRIEIFYFLRELEKHGFRWQSVRLRNHINLAIKKGRFTVRSTDPMRLGGCSQ